MYKPGTHYTAEVGRTFRRAVGARTLSKSEARVVLTLEENHQTTVTRQEIIRILGKSLKAADHVIEALRTKGWLERVSWGKYELISFDKGSTFPSFDKKTLKF